MHRKPLRRQERRRRSASFRSSPDLPLQALEDRRQVRLVRQASGLLPLGRGGQHAHCLHRLELAFGDHREEAAIAHDRDEARHLFHRAGIKVQKLRLRVAGAGLDDPEEEPAKRAAWSPAVRPSNVIVTPRSAYYSEESILLAREVAASEVARVLTGEPPLNPVNDRHGCRTHANLELKDNPC